MSAIEKGLLEPMDRLSLVRDSFALAKAGESSNKDFLNLCTVFINSNEKENVVWSAIIEELSKINF